MREPIIRMFLYLITGVLVIWALTPFIYAGIISISGLTLPTKLGLPSDITISNYIEALRDREVWRATMDSLIIAAIATLICLISIIPASYVFSRCRSKASYTLLMVFLIFRLFPWVVLAFPIFLMMSRFRMLDTYPGVSIAHSVWFIPTGIWYMKSFFDLVPREMEEAALVDGATTFQTLKEIILPLALPGALVVGILAFFSSYIEYLYSLILTRVNVVTLPVLMAGYLSEFEIEWRKISAISMLSTGPMVIFYAYILKYMRRGIIFGVVKG